MAVSIQCVIIATNQLTIYKWKSLAREQDKTIVAQSQAVERANTTIIKLQKELEKQRANRSTWAFTAQPKNH